MPFFERAPVIGFSTGALALGDWREGLRQSRELGLEAIELSALRFAEFSPLVAALDDLSLDGFSYVSIHLPSHFQREQEAEVIRLATRLASKKWPLVMHPDAIHDWSAWAGLGDVLCLENMDKRKPIGRTVEELDRAFELLPEASFCFDFGHARQVDPTMSQAEKLLETFGDRLRQIHFSEVDSSNRHRTLNHPALSAFVKVRELAANAIAVILETPVAVDEAEVQLKLSRRFFSRQHDRVAVA